MSANPGNLQSLTFFKYCNNDRRVIKSIFEDPQDTFYSREL